MPNPLFQNQLIDQYNQFKSNPIAFLAQRKVNIPQQYMNNPQEAVQYLMNNGIMSQGQYNQLAQLAQTFNIK